MQSQFSQCCVLNKGYAESDRPITTNRRHANLHIDKITNQSAQRLK